jgi:hypothetical protein
MKTAKPYKWLLILVPVVAAVVFLFSFRMYHDDIKALKGFMASYDRFDKAISGLSLGKADDLESKASSAVADLSAKAALRLSSLIKNDAELMDQAREVADLSRRELDSFRAYDAVPKVRNPDPDEAGKEDKLGKEYSVLRGKREAAYARFQELAGIR